ncbi:autotransporter domain-containing protein [Phreatobacter sp. AB_2022a]|uniref:autotransporter domain-containing protein n=1 Tax=Phreatobacter sp. AB_2022a TaxID=3003134 RepID=UPI002287190E|nr:autotransporter domain-containing protein [Phreatobacter sp. AB_2022a]MCZ0734455.1 autotransporter domain-containing protein [Phreatobacter sp. AB_2022a]
MLAALGLGTDPARAQCAPSGGSNYVCSGPNTTTQSINAADVAVTTTPGFGVDLGASNGNGLAIIGAGQLSYIDTNAATITGGNAYGDSGLLIWSTGNNGPTLGSVTVDTGGAITGYHGISVSNSGGGLTSVTAGGVVTGLSGEGISVINGAAASGLTVRAATVTGATSGIVAYNNGTGATLVMASGQVTGTGRYGIFASNAASAGDLTIDAAAVTGGISGIYAENRGSGATLVTASGNVEGTQNYGILAVNGTANLRTDGTLQSATPGTANGLTVAVGTLANPATATGGMTGIYAYNNGTGATEVTATGQVTGTNGAGLFALNGAGATSLTVNAGAVLGGTDGIFATNRGSGATSVAATGSVVGTAGYGIFAQNDTAATTLTVTAASATGGLAGIYADNQGTGATLVTATGPVSGTGGAFGLFALNGATATSLTAEVAAVNGAINGITAENRGSGATRVTAAGAVTGTSGTGIEVQNGAGATDLAVGATAVSGRFRGIDVFNSGTGNTLVVASGLVAGANDAGINVVNNPGANHLTIEAAAVTGGLTGILARNNGHGDTSVTATGDVVGTARRGLDVYNNSSAGGLTVHAASVTGGIDGIFVENRGAGTTLVTASGSVIGAQLHGIAATNGQFLANPDGTFDGLGSGPAGDLSVRAAAVSGGVTGILAANGGSGATYVTATGLVNGGSGEGISALNGPAAGKLSIDAAAVSGGGTGILARNSGTGSTLVTASGPVVGTSGDGIAATNAATAGALTIHARAVTGGNYGIYASGGGAGATEVTATGPVVGTGASGIFVLNGAATTGLTVTAEAVSGARYGVSVGNFGTGPTRIATSGLVEGGMGAIFAGSAGQPIEITTNGLVRNLSGLSASLAIETSGGLVTYTNAGGLIGTVKFGVGAHTMANDAAWNTAGGTSQFGGGALTNAAGVAIIAASGSGAPVTTTFEGLASFVNRGLLVMADGVAGDIVRQTGGGARFEAGSLLAVDIDRTGRADRFASAGAVSLTGATLAVNGAGGIATYGTRYTVVSADGGLTGRFASVSGLPADTAFLTMRDTYDANNAYLEVQKYRTFASAGLTRNQIATAGGLDSLGPGPLVGVVAGFTSDVAARAAFDLVSGEIHASAKAALIEDSGFLREAAIGRLRSAFGTVAAASAPVNMADINGRLVAVAPTTERFAIWGQGYGAWGRTNGDGNAARLSHSTGGFFLGFDGPLLDTWRIGLLAGYSRTSFNVRDRASSGASDNYHLGAFAGTQWGPIGLRSGLAFTWHELATTRTVAFAGFGDMLRARYGARTFQAFSEAGYRIDAFGAAFEPFVNLAHVSLATDAFSETGGAAALTGEGRTTATTFTTLGLRASASFMIGGIGATARGTLGWRHAFGAVLPLATNAFAGGAGFTVAGVPIARDAAVIEAGLDFALSPAATLGVGYAGQIAGSAQQHGFKGSLAVRF